MNTLALRQNAPEAAFSERALIGDALRSMRKRQGAWLATWVATLGVSLVMVFVVEPLAAKPMPASLLPLGVAGLALTYALLTIIVASVALAATNPDLATEGNPLRILWRAGVAAARIYVRVAGLVAVVTVPLVLSTVAGVFPGFLLAGRWLLAPVLVSKGDRPIAALRTSWRATAGSSMRMGTVVFAILAVIVPSNFILLAFLPSLVNAGGLIFPLALGVVESLQFVWIATVQRAAFDVLDPRRDVSVKS